MHSKNLSDNKNLTKLQKKNIVVKNTDIPLYENSINIRKIKVWTEIKNK